MVVTLRGLSGPGLDVLVSLRKGDRVTVGRADRADIPIPADTFLSGTHFVIECHPDAVILRDLNSSNGIFISGRRITEQELVDGNSFSAGSSVFQVEIKAGDRVLPDPLEVLSSQPDPLFAVLDTARDSKIRDLLLLSGAQYYSLYQGKAAVELEHVAPYLVSLPPGCELLQKIVGEGWSKSWGIFLTCGQPIDQVWHQLRRSLMVTLEGKPDWVYFRFYDPRVLRVFLPIADLEQLQQFGGPISSFLMEDEDPTVLLRFDTAGGAIGVERIVVRTEKEVVPGEIA